MADSPRAEETAAERDETPSERYLNNVARRRIEELEDALRGLIACHGMKPAPNCGFLLRAREVLADDQ